VFGDILIAKRRFVENKNLCKLVYVEMNAHLVPNSLLPEIDNEVASFVSHIELEACGDIMSFAEHVDSEAEVSMELCRQLAGANQPIVPSSSSDEDMGEDNVEGSRGDI
jgi:hypothetical protein